MIALPQAGGPRHDPRRPGRPAHRLRRARRRCARWVFPVGPARPRQLGAADPDQRPPARRAAHVARRARAEDLPRARPRRSRRRGAAGAARGPAARRRHADAPGPRARSLGAARRRRAPGSTWLEIVLTEGKNRQVRRMGAAVGHEVLELVRVRIGRLGLGDARAGRVARAHAAEVAELAGRVARPAGRARSRPRPRMIAVRSHRRPPMILAPRSSPLAAAAPATPDAADPRRGRAHGAGRRRRAPRPARPPRAQQPRGAHRAPGVRAAARPRPRGALPGREDGRRGRAAGRPARRCGGAARRHRRAADRGDERPAVQEPDEGRDARLRPRRPHGDPARRRARCSRA